MICGVPYCSNQDEIQQQKRSIPWSYVMVLATRDTAPLCVRSCSQIFATPCVRTYRTSSSFLYFSQGRFSFLSGEKTRFVRWELNPGFFVCLCIIK